MSFDEDQTTLFLISFRREFDLISIPTHEDRLDDLGFDSLGMFEIVCFVDDWLDLHSRITIDEYPIYVTVGDLLEHISDSQR